MASGAPSASARKVAKVLGPSVTPEGKGVIVSRSIGRPEQSELDPFLLFDDAILQAPAGFPDHPHRGFETVSYMLKGKFKHEDFAGHEGELREGDLQWMTAGRGIVHSELPAGKGECRGLQLWVNLPAADKMCPPASQELKHEDIPVVTKDGVTVKVIAGSAFGVTSQVFTRIPMAYLDFSMEAGAKLEQPIPPGWNSFLYVLQGSVAVGDEGATSIGPRHTVVLNTAGADLAVWNKGEEQNRFVLIAGQPLQEPVARYGPFVMNSREELQDAFVDYRVGRNGFERVHTWRRMR